MIGFQSVTHFAMIWSSFRVNINSLILWIWMDEDPTCGVLLDDSPKWSRSVTLGSKREQYAESTTFRPLMIKWYCDTGRKENNMPCQQLLNLFREQSWLCRPFPRGCPADIIWVWHNRQNSENGKCSVTVRNSESFFYQRIRLQLQRHNGHHGVLSGVGLCVYFVPCSCRGLPRTQVILNVSQTKRIDHAFDNSKSSPLLENIWYEIRR